MATLRMHPGSLEEPTEARWGAALLRVADPKITLASAASLFVGACAAARDGALSWPWLAVTWLGIFCLEAAKNASGEIFDWDSGADQAVTPAERSPFSGGKRVLVDGLLDRRRTALLAAAFYLLGAAAGLAVVIWREPQVLWLGIIGVALAYSYSGRPVQLAYRGLGEPAVALCYGPLIAEGCYLAQRHALSARLALLSVPLGLLIAAFLWVNELPDRRADEGAGKRTLVVRLGPRLAGRAFFFLVLAAYLGVCLLPLAGLPLPVWLGLVGLPLAASAAWRLWDVPDAVSELVPAQQQTLLAFVLTALGLGTGLVA